VSRKYISKESKQKYVSEPKSGDGSYTTSNANELARQVFVKGCMYRKGWMQTKAQ